MNDGLTISFPATDTTDERRTKVANMAEGAVHVVMGELASGMSFDDGGLQYENPRQTRSGSQKIGSLEEVLRRGRATCLEICCIVVAAERMAGKNCFVRVLSVKYRKKTRPFVYHSVVYYPDDGHVFDASEMLEGYDVNSEWWERPGHCCYSCALDEECQGDCSCGGQH